MPRCSFCKQNYEFPRGLTYILNDGNILYFCSSKCRRNQLKLKRDNKRVNWVRKAGETERADSESKSEHKEYARVEQKVEVKETPKIDKKK